MRCKSLFKMHLALIHKALPTRLWTWVTTCSSSLAGDISKILLSAGLPRTACNGRRVRDSNSISNSNGEAPGCGAIKILLSGAAADHLRRQKSEGSNSNSILKMEAPGFSAIQIF